MDSHGERHAESAFQRPSEDREVPSNEPELNAYASRVETLVREVESCRDPSVRRTVIELLQALLQLYGWGLGRMVQALAQRDRRLLDHLAQDDLVAHLLLLHGLHPVPLERRVAEGVAQVRPALQSHGGDIELVGTEGGVARLRLRGSCHACPSSAMTLRLTVEEALRKAAPDLEAIEVEQPNSPGVHQITIIPDPAPSRDAHRTV